MVLEVEVFISSTCPYCPMAVTAAEEAKAELGDKINVDIINISKSENVAKAREYNIMAVPSIAIDGLIEFMGAPSKEELIYALNNKLAAQ